MSRVAHQIYIGILGIIIILVLAWLIYSGFDYYNTSLEERFYHDSHGMLKPSGPFGHGYGIIGTLFILIGVFSYMARKRWKILSRMGILKHWLEFHIFLCILGPILILFHTAFKFGGIVSISFWSMVAVVLSGVIGRYIYIQIPRSIHGNELSLAEIRESVGKDQQVKVKSQEQLNKIYDEILSAITINGINGENKGFSAYIRQNRIDRKKIRNARVMIRKAELPRSDKKTLMAMVKSEISINRKIERLSLMRDLFKYWHIAHLPFAIIMLLIMIIHVVITLLFGYRWIF